MPAYNRQLKDEDGNIIYPIINDGSLQNNSVTTGKIADGAVTESKIDWSNVSPCVSEFIFSGTQMPTTDQHITKTTKRGTELTFFMSANSIFIESGADNINKVRYSINYAHPSTTSAYGCTGLSPNSTIYSYYTGYNNSSAVNTKESSSTGSSTYGTLISSGGDKFCFAATFDAIRPSSDSNYTRRNVWNLLGQIISMGSFTSFTINSESVASSIGTVPAWYQRGVNASYYYIIVEVWED